MTDSLTSPVGHYQPQVLLLASKENPLDGHTLSFMAQLLELGIPFELDEHWQLPTQPPKDFSAYKTVILPETLKDKYDKDLDAYYAAGGFLYYDKYYPLSTQLPKTGFTSGTAAFLFHAWGRDLYFWSAAHYLMEAGVTYDDADFRRTFERRAVSSILDDFRQSFIPWANREGPIRSWGDTTYTTLMAHLALARRLNDPVWIAAADRCLQRLADAVPWAFEDPLRVQELPIKGAPINCFETMGHLLLKRGSQISNRAWIDAGIKMVRYYADNVFEKRGAELIDRRGNLLYSGEAMTGVPPLLWLARCSGEKRYTELAEKFFRSICARTHAENGLWHHWADLNTGAKGSFWSRMQMWPAFVMTEILEAIDPATALAELVRGEIRKTFDGMARVQDAQSGSWHLIADDPDSRIESTVAQHALYAHDRLRELDVLDARYQSMMDRAFVGLKRLYYRGGLAASCRGTACGTREYYRTRPQGFASTSIFPACLASRLESR